MNFKNRSLSVKILALCSTFLLPIVFLVYTVVTAYNKDIDFARYEHLGDRYLRPLFALPTWDSHVIP